jgi:hypothetical protein
MTIRDHHIIVKSEPTYSLQNDILWSEVVKKKTASTRSHTHARTCARTHTHRNWEHFSNTPTPAIIATPTASPAAVVWILFSAFFTPTPLPPSSTLFDSLLCQLPRLSLSIPTNLRASEGGERDETVLKAIPKLNFVSQNDRVAVIKGRVL